MSGRSPNPRRATTVPRGWSDVRETPCGVRLLADRTHPQFVPGVVTVYLHGIVSGPGAWLKPIHPAVSGEDEWRTPVELVATAFGMVTDALLFRYPSNPLVRGSTPEAAARLLAELEDHVGSLGMAGTGTQASRVPHPEPATRWGLPPRDFGPPRLILVAHSNGGLVAKRALLPDAGGAGTRTMANGPSLLDRTDWLLNLAVPHHGGKRGLAPIAVAATVVSAVAGTATRILSPLSAVADSLAWLRRAGFNSIVWDLAQPQGKLPGQSRPPLRALETKWQATIEHRRQLGLHLHAELDVASTDDVAVPEDLEFLTAPSHVEAAQKRPKWGTIRHGRPRTVRIGIGGHPIGQLDWSTVVRAVTRRAGPLWFEHATRQLARTAARASARIEQHLGVERMLGTEAPPETHQQGHAEARLIRELLSPRESRRRAVLLHRAAGVGKTRVASRVMRTLCDRWESTPDEPGAAARVGPHPVLLLQLQKLALTPEELDRIRSSSPADARQTLLGVWARRVAPDLDVEWPFLLRWASAATEVDRSVFILDGVDNLLRAHPQLRLETLLGPWVDLATDATAAARPRVVAVVRSGFPGIEVLSSALDQWLVIPLAHVDESWARSAYPDSMTVIDRVDPKRFRNWDAARKAALSPLVLPVLGYQRGDEGVRCECPTDLLSLAADGRLAKRLDDLGAARPTISPATARLLLAVIAREFYGASIDPVLTYAQLREGAGARLAAMEERGHLAAAEARQSLEDWNAAGQVLTAFLTANGPVTELATSRWSIDHETWRDLFVGQYYAEVVRLRWVAEIGAVAYLPDITTHASVQLRGFQLDREIVEECARKTAETGDVFYLANIHAMYSWNPGLQRDPGARSAQLDAMTDPATPAFCRYFIMNGLLSSDIATLSAARSAEQPEVEFGRLTPTIAALHVIERDERFDAISRSQAWFYLEELAALTARPELATGRPWPGLPVDAGRAAAESAYAMANTLKRHVLQSAFADLVGVLPRLYSTRRIATAHYLWVLACAVTDSRGRASTRSAPALHAFRTDPHGDGVSLFCAEDPTASNLPPRHARFPDLKRLAWRSATLDL